MLKHSFVGVGILALAIGCGGDSGGQYGDPIPSPQGEMAGGQAVDGAAMLGTLSADLGNESAVGQSFAIYGNLSVMVSSKMGAQAAPDPGTSAVWDPACVSISGDTATYTACDASGTTIDGTITATATMVTMDLMMDTGQVVIDMDGTLNFSATSINGTLSYDTSIDAGGQTITTTYEGIYDVTLDGAGCPTGGQVEARYNVSGPAGMEIFAKAEFGPNCGDVTFF